MFPWFLRLKYWTSDFFHGSPMRKAYREMGRVQRLPINKLKEYKEQRLFELLTFVQQNCPFYSEYSSYDLSDYPVMDKSRYLENYEKFLVNPSLIPNQEGELHIASTSGSTGTPFKIPQDTNCRTRRIAMIKYGNAVLGFKSFDLLMHLRSGRRSAWASVGGMRYDKKLNIIYVDNANLSEQRLSEVCDTINKLKVKIIRGYMTSLDFITRYAVDHKIQFKHKPTFISVGELLTEGLRTRVSNDLKCSIISQYGNEECGIFGQSKINGSGHEITLFQANHIVEILKFDSDQPCQPGELGRVVVTDLTNKAFPMIRYDVGDVAAVDQFSENMILSLKSFCGRKNDLILNTKGEFVDCFNNLPSSIVYNPSITQWQFIQKTKVDYTLILSLSGCAEFNFEEAVLILHKFLGEDANISIEVVDNIPVLSSGKRKIIINEYKQGL